VSLLPRRPAGRANRKALAFAAEILRLRAEGHSFEAIRDALADAGVKVNASTVRREVLRCRSTPATPSVTATPQAGASPPARALPAAHLVASESRSGREVAETFTRGHISHPLLRKESQR
jgi:predicted component of type VI protein secretion system